MSARDDFFPHKQAVSVCRWHVSALHLDGNSCDVPGHHSECANANICWLRPISDSHRRLSSSSDGRGRGRPLTRFIRRAETAWVAAPAMDSKADLNAECAGTAGRRVALLALVKKEWKATTTAGSTIPREREVLAAEYLCQLHEAQYENVYIKPPGTSGQ